ncbi:MAG: HesA/MoeB/ThiF family protein [Pseudomonadota bacterium]
MSRYARQIMLPEIGASGQNALRAARVLVVGAGGLAAPVLQYLVGAGVGQITLVDGDEVSLSNLHRQTLFREGDVGQMKVEAAARRLHDLNMECTISGVLEPLSPENAKQLVSQCTIALDCADSFAASYILSDHCLAADVPLISASVLGMAGYVGGFCGTVPSLRAVFPDLPDRAATCATAGVMGPAVGMIGAAQAQMAMAQITGQSPSPLGQMMHFDMKTYRSASFRFDGAPEPKSDFNFISQADIAPDDFVIELRDDDEAPVPVCQAARRLNVAEFKRAELTPDTAQRAVFACRSGLRAWQAATHLRSYWAGNISLIAMGDAPDTERQT